MPNSTPIRTSGRKRQRTSYALDVFDDLNLSGSSASEDETPAKRKSADDEDDEFSAGADGQESVEEGNDMNGGQAGIDNNKPSEEDSEEFDEEDLEEEDDVMSIDQGTKKARRVKGGMKREKIRTLKEIPAFEEIPPDVVAKVSRPAYTPVNADSYNARRKSDRIAANYGKDEKEIAPLLRYRDKWGNEKCLPRKSPTLKNDQGGFHESYYQSDEQRLQERTADWNWYWKYGSKAFVEKQKTRILKEQEGRGYMQIQRPNGKTVLLGPVKDRKPYRLNPLESISFGEAWSSSRTKSHTPGTSNESSREGWLINVGDGKVQSLDWCPNSHGRIHFLAVSTIDIKKDESAPIKKLHKKAQAREEGQERNRPVPQNAFTPGPSTPSCIEIWAVAASDANRKDGRFNLSKAPRLCQVICTNWGAVRHLKWSPAPRTPKQTPRKKRAGLGLLAGLWGDGEVRVIDVNVEMAKDSTEWIQCTQTAFSHRPSSTIHTCISWLSSTHLAAGCANGFIAVYDLEALLSPSKSPFSKEKVQRPYFYHPVHHTYISALTSGYPSRPNFIISSAMDGYVGVTDIHAPETDSMMSLRSRQGASALAWCEAAQVIIVGWEDTTIRFLHLRRSYTSSIIGRTGSVATAMATSRVHPCLIASSTDGAVVATNPLRKFWSFKSAVYQQIWFWHEWSNRNEVEGGISRITEGFRVDKGAEKKGMYTKNSVLLATLYEEEQAATCLAWCPSLECGGWAAAGMGSGLVRIEDLSI